MWLDVVELYDWRCKTDRTFTFRALVVKTMAGDDLHPANRAPRKTLGSETTPQVWSNNMRRWAKDTTRLILPTTLWHPGRYDRNDSGATRSTLGAWVHSNTPVTRANSTRIRTTAVVFTHIHTTPNVIVPFGIYPRHPDISAIYIGILSLPQSIY